MPCRANDKAARDGTFLVGEKLLGRRLFVSVSRRREHWKIRFQKSDERVVADRLEFLQQRLAQIKGRFQMPARLKEDSGL